MNIHDFKIILLSLIITLFLNMPFTYSQTTAHEYFQSGKTASNQTGIAQTSSALNDIKAYYDIEPINNLLDIFARTADYLNKNINISPKLEKFYSLRRSLAFTPNLIPDLSNEQISGLSAYRFDTMNQSQISSLSPAQMSAVTNQQFSGLTDIQKGYFNQAQIQGLNMAYINVNNLLDTQTAYLTAAQVKSISTINFKNMNNEKLKNLPPAAMSGVTNAQLSGLTAAQKESLSKAQIQWLNMTDINVNDLLDPQTAYLTPDQVSSIPEKNFAAMNDTKMKNLSQSIF